MLNPEKYFDDIYEYMDLWVSGFTAAYCQELDHNSHEKIKSRMIESVIARLDVINSLRLKLGLDYLSIDDSYDYYINNLPEFEDADKSIDLQSFDEKTSEYSKLEQTLCAESADVKIYLVLMGAPNRFVENYHPIQRRVEMANKLFIESGFNKMQPKEIENLLIRMLVASNNY